jgi:hypothetical protein
MRRLIYWTVAGALVVYGALGILSIGLPVLVAGVIMIVGGITGWPARYPRIFWPVVAAIAGFFAGILLVAPAWCEISVTAGAGQSTTAPTSCRSFAGITYRGAADYEPPAWPGLAAGALAGLAAASAARAAIGRTRTDAELRP